MAPKRIRGPGGVPDGFLYQPNFKEDAYYKGASYGWQNFIASLERIAGGLD